MRILGVDLGSKRVGIALSDPLGRTARPLETISAGNATARVKQLVESYQVGRVVVGLPKTLSGQLGPQAREVLEWVEGLTRELEVPVDTWDERLTTVEAGRVPGRGRKRGAPLDEIAAALLLQTYLDRASSQQGEQH